MMRTTALSIALICGAGLAAQAEVSMDKVSYGGWENCVRLSNGAVELVVTTDVGPRVIRFGFVDGQNVFKEYAEQLGQTGGDEWLIYGGHRLWHAPEAKPRTYWADNVPVEYEWDGKALRLFQPVEESTGIRKEMDIVLDPDGPHVTVQHRLINENAWGRRSRLLGSNGYGPGRACYLPAGAVSCAQRLSAARAALRALALHGHAGSALDLGHEVHPVAAGSRGDLTAEGGPDE